MKNFAKIYWREFEKLLKIIIESSFDNQYKISSHLTKESKDGGYDLFVLISSEQFEFAQSLLGEAKLRDFKKNDLSLSEFSKTFIIAVNLLVDHVVIATNIHFTENTNKVIENFSQRTGIHYCLLDLNDIQYWINQHSHQIQNINSQFIQELLSHNSQKTNNKKNISFHHFIPKNAEQLIGDKRKQLFQEIMENILLNYSHNFDDDFRSAHYIIQSYRKNGKTVFIRNIIKELDKNKIVNYCIDLSKFSISRDLFLEFLSILWCVKKEDILLQCTHLLDITFKNLNIAYFDEDTKKAIKSLLTIKESYFNNDPDYWDMLLLEYLKKIALPIIHRIHPTIIFENLSYANKKVLDFALKIFNYFYDLDLLFIIEQQYDKSANNYFQNKKSQIITLPDLENIDCKELLQMKYANIPDDIEPILHICSNNPFYLIHLYPILSEIKDTKIFQQIDSHKLLYNNEKLAFGYLEESIKRQFQNLDTDTKKIIAIIGLLDGEILYKQLEIIYSQYMSYVPYLDELEYFEVELDRISIKTLIYKKYIQQISLYLTKYEIIDVMNMLLDSIDRLGLDVFLEENILFEIYSYFKNIPKITSFIHKITEHLLLLSEFDKCLYYLKKAYSDIYNTANLQDKIWLNNHIIYCYIMLNDYQNSQLSLYIHDQNRFFEFHKEKYYDDYLNFIYIDSKRALALGQYQKILDLTSSVINDKQKSKIEIMERIIQMKFLAIKHLETMEKALHFLKEEIVNYPQSSILNYTLLTHQSDIFKGNMKYSLTCFYKIKEYYSQVTLEEQEHNENNIAVCYFYQKDFSKSMEAAWKIQNTCFLNNICIEEGRAYHTIAMNFIALKQFEESEFYFKKALNIFIQNSHVTHIWPIYINLSTIYIIHKKVSSLGLEYINYAIEYLLNYYLDSLKFIKDQHISQQPKYYVGLLIALNNLFILTNDQQNIYDKINDFNIEQLRKDTQRYIFSQKLNIVLKDTIYNVEDYLILKI